MVRAQFSVLSPTAKMPRQELFASERGRHHPEQHSPNFGLFAGCGERGTIRQRQDADVRSGPLPRQRLPISRPQVAFVRIDIRGKQKRVAPSAAASELQLIKALAFGGWILDVPLGDLSGGIFLWSRRRQGLQMNLQGPRTAQR